MGDGARGAACVGARFAVGALDGEFDWVRVRSRGHVVQGDVVGGDFGAATGLVAFPGCTGWNVRSGDMSVKAKWERRACSLVAAVDATHTHW